MNKQKHYYAVAGLVVIGTIVSYIFLQAIYPLPKAASAEAKTIDFMFDVYFGLIAFMFALIMAFILYASFVFRRQPDDTEDAAHIHGNTTLEIIWTVLPVILVIGLGVWGALEFRGLVSAKENEMVINVTGQQWSWSFEYPEQEDIVSAQLFLPVNRPIVLKMNSEDVLHSFWVPEFRVKQDLVPGYEQELRFEPTVIGRYKVRCAEICGKDHTTMLADVQVVSESDFAAWVEERSARPAYADLTPVERGELWYNAATGDWAGCVGCHSVDGAVRAGPTWLDIYGRTETLTDGATLTVDDTYIRQSIQEPNAQIVEGFNPNIMPQDYVERFTAVQAEILADEGVEIDIIADLIAFMQTLEE